MNRLSLFTRYDAREKVLRLHDVMRKMMLKSMTHIKEIQGQLLNKWINKTQLPDDYAWNNIAYLHSADRPDTLRDLLLKLNYLKNKLNAIDINALIAHCKSITDDDMISLLSSALSISSHLLRENPTALATQLRGRLGYHNDARIQEFMEKLPTHVRKRHADSSN